MLKPKFFFRKYEYLFFTFSSPKKTWILHITAGFLYILYSIMWSSNILHVKNLFNIRVCVCMIVHFFKEKLMCQVRNMIETYLLSSRKMETKSTYCFFWFIGLLFQWNIIQCLYIHDFESPSCFNVQIFQLSEDKHSMKEIISNMSHYLNCFMFLLAQVPW